MSKYTLTTNNPLTADKLYCHYLDPYVYHQTYNLHTLPKPEEKGSDVEQLIKDMIFNGAGSVMALYSFDAPINKATGRPYGSETQKYANWVAECSEVGITPMHPDKLAVADEIVNHFRWQTAEKRAPEMSKLLGTITGQGVVATCAMASGAAETVIDGVTTSNDLVLIRCVYSLPALLEENNPYAEALAFKAAFDSTVYTKANKLPDKSGVYIILIERNAPFRVSVVRLDREKWLPRVHVEDELLSAKLKAGDSAEWGSPFTGFCRVSL